MLPALQGAQSIKTKNAFLHYVSSDSRDKGQSPIPPILPTGKRRRRAVPGLLKHWRSLTALFSLNSCPSVLCRIYELQFLENKGDGTRVGAAIRVPSDKWQVTFMNGVGWVYPAGSGWAWTNQKGVPSLAPDKYWHASQQIQHHQVF